jgi:hypothetical protein
MCSGRPDRLNELRNSAGNTVVLSISPTVSMLANS